MEMVVEIDGDGSGGTSPSRQGAGTETFCPPNLPFGGGGAVELFVAGGLMVSEKIGTLAFVPSNSENINFLTFLEPKTAETRKLALWHLVNRLVQEII